jgi:hypothetical protein
MLLIMPLSKLQGGTVGRMTEPVRDDHKLFHAKKRHPGVGVSFGLGGAGPTAMDPEKPS